MYHPWDRCVHLCLLFIFFQENKTIIGVLVTINLLKHALSQKNSEKYP